MPVEDPTIARFATWVNSRLAAKAALVDALEKLEEQDLQALHDRLDTIMLPCGGQVAQKPKPLAEAAAAHIMTLAFSMERFVEGILSAVCGDEEASN